MELASTIILIMASICMSVLASLGAVYVVERKKKNGFKKEYKKEKEKNGGEIGKLEELAHRIIERERLLQNDTSL